MYFVYEVFLHIFIEIIIICFWGIKLSCFRTLLVMGKIMGVGNSSLPKLFVQLILELFCFDFMYWICLTIFLMLNIRSRLILMNFFARVFKLIPSFMSIRFRKMTSFSFVHVIYVLVSLHFLSLSIVLQICSLHHFFSYCGTLCCNNWILLIVALSFFACY